LKFTSFLCQHDIICLTESWTNNKSIIDLNGYSRPIHSYRRYQHRRAKRSSGGIIIYIKDTIRKGVSLVRNDLDCIVWLKLDKTYFKNDSDIYLAVIYIPPENSVVHDMYEEDLFSKLESDVTFFNNRGKVFITGDANARTGHKADFIVNDRNLCDIDFLEIDTPLQRSACDRGSNRFGDYLLDLCKSTNIRIVNGRLFKDKGIGKLTCYTNNGESTVDYLLTSYKHFKDIADFKVHDFNEFSNHAPLTFALNANNLSNNGVNNPRIHFAWNSEFKDQFLQHIAGGVQDLENRLRR
jgi:exonuclease III